MPSLMLPYRPLGGAEGGQQRQGAATSRLVRVLAGIWLALALVGFGMAVRLLGLLLRDGGSGDAMPAAVMAMIGAFAMMAFWAFPLTLASLGILTRCGAYRAGIGVLMAHAGIGALFWTYLWLTDLPYVLRWMVGLEGDAPVGAGALVLALFSAITVLALIRELWAGAERTTARL